MLALIFQFFFGLGFAGFLGSLMISTVALRISGDKLRAHRWGIGAPCASWAAITFVPNVTTPHAWGLIHVVGLIVGLVVLTPACALGSALVTSLLKRWATAQ